MMLDPPGATITEPPFRLPSGGRKTVRKGLSKGPLPTASGTLPSAHRGMLKLTDDLSAVFAPPALSAFGRSLSAVQRMPETARTAATSRQRTIGNTGTTMHISVCLGVARVKG